MRFCISQTTLSWWLSVTRSSVSVRLSRGWLHSLSVASVGMILRISWITRSKECYHQPWEETTLVGSMRTVWGIYQGHKMPAWPLTRCKAFAAKEASPSTWIRSLRSLNFLTMESVPFRKAAGLYKMLVAMSPQRATKAARVPSSELERATTQLLSSGSPSWSLVCTWATKMITLPHSRS